MSVASSCNDPAMLPVISVIVKIFEMIQIIGPSLAVVSLMILLFKLMLNPEDVSYDGKRDKIKHGIKNSIMSFVILFFLPLFVNLTMQVLGENFTVSSCWNAARNYKMSNSTNYIDRNSNKKKSKIVDKKNYDKGSSGTSAGSGAAGMAKAFVNLAVSQRGTHGGSKYLKYQGLSDGPWCTEFVAWCIGNTTNNGEKMTKYFNYIAAANTNYISYCKSHSNTTWHSANSSYAPKTGDLIFFDWERDGTSDHIGIVQSAKGNRIKTIEGNCGNKVCERNTSTSDRDIYGYCSWY